MYTAMGYNTDHYDNKSTQFKEFKSLDKLWTWCREFLTPGNRCVVVHSTDKRWKWGMNRDRPRSCVRKIGTFRDVSQLPKW